MTIPEQAAHKVMTPEEYASMQIKGWHSVCRNYDGHGAVGIRFHTDGAAQNAEEPAPDCWAPWRALADAPVIPTKPNLKSTLFLGSRYGGVGDAREIFQGNGFGNQCIAVAINGDVAERLVQSANSAQSLVGVQRPEEIKALEAARAEYCRIIAKAVDDRKVVTPADGMDAMRAALTAAQSLIKVQRPEDVARAIEAVIHTHTIGSWASDNRKRVANEITAAVLALPHTAQPQEGAGENNPLASANQSQLSDFSELTNPGKRNNTLFDALMDITVSAFNLEIAITCGSHESKDAILDFLTGAAPASPQRAEGDHERDRQVVKPIGQERP